jgi:hypothetical protein
LPVALYTAFAIAGATDTAVSSAPLDRPKAPYDGNPLPGPRQRPGQLLAALSAAKDENVILFWMRHELSPCESRRRVSGSESSYSLPQCSWRQAVHTLTFRAKRLAAGCQDVYLASAVTAKGSRHPKRYMDVEELLDAGIDVYTTLR